MFVKGKSGNQLGRPRGVTDKVTAEWRRCCQLLVADPVYRASLQQRLIAGTLPPLVETRIWAYAFGEAPKAPEEKQQGMVVNLGFLGFLRPEESGALVSPPPTHLALADTPAQVEVVEGKLTE